MSKHSRKEYMKTMGERYHKAKSRKDKSAIINEIVKVTEYNRRYVLQKLNLFGYVQSEKQSRPKERVYPRLRNQTRKKGVEK